MATILREDGQAAVGGLIEVVCLPDGRLLIVDEDGKIRRDGPRPINWAATRLVAGVLDDIIVGPAVLATPRELGEEE